jgi:large subunit ribosomal protein L3
VPGASGGWILVRDAAKRALPEGVPVPGAFRAGGGAAKADEDAKAPAGAMADDLPANEDGASGAAQETESGEDKS